MEAHGGALELARARVVSSLVLQDDASGGAFYPNRPSDDASTPTEAAAKDLMGSHHRRVRRTYLSMIAMAFILTIISPGTILWPSSSCGVRAMTNITHGNVTTATSYPSIRHNTLPATGECVLYGRSVDLLVLAKLTCWTLLLILLFYNLLGSDPGLLTEEAMRRVDDGDETATTSTEFDCDGEGAEEADLERQSFLDPIPLASTKGASISQSMHSQDGNNRKLYPHTRRKFCDKCRIHPPLRSHHCHDCGACVATFDHHCHFLGTCIGERNHFRFWLFLLLNVVCVKLALGIVGTAHLPRGMVAGVVRMEVGWAVLILAKLYMYPIYLAASLLWAMHTALAVGNVTTFEFAKGSDHIDYLRGTGMMDFPFGRGLCGNLRMFLSRDDVFRWIKRRLCQSHDKTSGWVPILWRMPEFIDREADWWENPWQNKYWSCC